MRVKSGLLIAVFFLVSGCATQARPPQSLQEKLAGKSPQQRVVAMRNICLTEAEWDQDQAIRERTCQFGSLHARNNLPYMPEVVRLKDICREMTEIYAENNQQ